MKLVCFDLDGTIIDGTEFIWQTIHDHIGSDVARRDSMRSRFLEGRVSYAEWARHDIGLMKERKATRKDILDSMKGLKLMKGASETLNELKGRGYKLAIISGSLDIVLEHFHIRKLFDRILINKIIFDSEGFVKDIEPTPFDFRHKADGLRKLARELGMDIKDTVFVGDHDNDVDVAAAAGLSIAFNCKSEKLRKIAGAVIDKKDLREILGLLP